MKEDIINSLPMSANDESISFFLIEKVWCKFTGSIYGIRVQSPFDSGIADRILLQTDFSLLSVKILLREDKALPSERRKKEKQKRIRSKKEDEMEKIGKRWRTISWLSEERKFQRISNSIWVTGRGRGRGRGHFHTPILKIHSSASHWKERWPNGRHEDRIIGKKWCSRRQFPSPFNAVLWQTVSDNPINLSLLFRWVA